MRPRVLIVGHGGAPAAEVTERKWEAVEDRMTLRILTEAERSTRRVHAVRPLRLGGRERPMFYSRLPLRLVRELLRFRPEVVIAQSPFEGAVAHVVRRVVRARVALIVEVHGDWRTASRVYGSSLRRAIAPLADLVARFALRAADGTRAVGPTMAELTRQSTSRPVDAVFPTYFDARAFFSSPPAPFPAHAGFVWIGTLQRYKNPAMLAAAWELVAERRPEARLMIVGSGPLQPVVDALVRTHSDSVSTRARLAPGEVCEALDAARALVLPSQSEGLPRVAIEAFARGRPVVATRTGGIPDIVSHEVNGLLVAPDDPSGLAEAIVRLTDNRDLAGRLGRAARATACSYDVSPDDYAESLHALVRSTLARSAGVG